MKLQVACCKSCVAFFVLPLFFPPCPFFRLLSSLRSLSRSGWWPPVVSVSGAPGGAASVSSHQAEGPSRNRARQAAAPRNGRNRREGLELTLPLNRGAGTTVSISEGEENLQETGSLCVRPDGAPGPTPDLEAVIVAGEWHPTGY